MEPRPSLLSFLIDSAPEQDTSATLALTIQDLERRLSHCQRENEELKSQLTKSHETAEMLQEMKRDFSGSAMYWEMRAGLSEQTTAALDKALQDSTDFASASLFQSRAALSDSKALFSDNWQLMQLVARLEEQHLQDAIDSEAITCLAKALGKAWWEAYTLERNRAFSKGKTTFKQKAEEYAKARADESNISHGWIGTLIPIGKPQDVYTKTPTNRTGQTNRWQRTGKAKGSKGKGRGKQDSEQ